MRNLPAAMKTTVRHSVIAVSAAVAFAAMAVLAGLRASAAEPMGIDLAPRPGVLLLANGEVIQGEITRAGDFFHVVVPNGEIRVKGSDVEARCDNLEEGYRFKRSNLRADVALEHLQLGQWCERHGLLDHAEQELAEAVAIEPKHPLADLLRRRIEIARRPAKPPAPSAASAPGVSASELDRLVRGLPSGVVESFAQSVQPVLSNNCTAAGCHGPQTTSRLNFMKAPAGQPAGRRVTQRNLYAALQWIDRKDPAKSPLLTAPLGPHGTAKAPIFGRGQIDQAQLLARWVYQAASAPNPLAPPDEVSQADSKAGPRAQPAASPFDEGQAVLASHAAAAKDDRPGFVRPAVAFEEEAEGGRRRHGHSPFEPPAADDRTPSEPPWDAKAPGHRPVVKRGDPTPGFKPVDPFDPEIFNRRHAPGQ